MFKTRSHSQRSSCYVRSKRLEREFCHAMSIAEGKLTSLEEFRIQKDTFEAQIKEAKEHLEQKERELPEQLERMERATVLRIEAYCTSSRNVITYSD